MRFEISFRNTCRIRGVWALLLLTASVCCALSVEALEIKTYWQEKPGSASLEVGAVFSGASEMSPEWRSQLSTLEIQQ